MSAETIAGTLALLLLGAAVVAGPAAFAWFSPRHRRALRIVAVAWTVLTLPPYALLVLLPDVLFAGYAVRCGHLPVTATTFAAADSYEEPGDYGYGPSLFNAAYFCSAAEAERAGYHRTPFRALLEKRTSTTPE